MTGARRVESVEVGPRTRLQNQPRRIPTSDKIALIDLLSQAGFRRIEAASFVSPKWVPQMADGVAVMAGIARVQNLQGCHAARAAAGIVAFLDRRPAPWAR